MFGLLKRKKEVEVVVEDTKAEDVKLYYHKGNYYDVIKVDGGHLKFINLETNKVIYVGLYSYDRSKYTWLYGFENGIRDSHGPYPYDSHKDIANKRGLCASSHRSTFANLDEAIDDVLLVYYQDLTRYREFERKKKLLEKTVKCNIRDIEEFWGNLKEI